MAIYVWSLTSEEAENSIATRWARAQEATLVPTSTSRRGGILARSGPGDRVVIVAHGSRHELGTSGDAVVYSPDKLADTLVNELGLPDQVQVVLAACESDGFAADLQARIQLLPTHRNVLCSGQRGAFMFSQDFQA